MTGNILRAQPQNVEAERALLGSLLLNNKALERVSEYLTAEQFFDPVNGRIYEACRKLVAEGKQANPITLKTFLERDELVTAAGGMKYIASLANSVVTVINAGDYGRLVHDLHMRRGLIEVAEELANAAFDATPDEGALDLIEKAEASLYALADTAAVEGGFKAFDEFASDAIAGFQRSYQHRGTTPGVPTGLADLDRKLGGLFAKNLIIVGGRPGMGKTALMTTVAFNVADHFQNTMREDHKDRTVGFFSLEMGGDELAGRILCARANVSFEDGRMGKLDQHDFDRLVAAKQELTTLPIYIDETPAVTVATMLSRARRLKRQKKKLGLIIVDYLGLAEPGETKDSNRVGQIDQITRDLKKMAKALEVPVVALAQLNRKVEERDDKRPQISDLRESGSIEANADVIMFLFRAQYYLERSEPKREPDESDDAFHNRMVGWQRALEEALNKAEVIVAKNRNGKTGTVKTFFHGEQMSFADYVDAKTEAQAAKAFDLDHDQGHVRHGS